MRSREYNMRSQEKMPCLVRGCEVPASTCRMSRSSLSISMESEQRSPFVTARSTDQRIRIRKKRQFSRS